MKNPGEYVVVYDISSNRERNKVHKLLSGFGFPIQKSVFECRLDTKGKRELLRKLKALEITSGFIKVYRLEYRSIHPEIGTDGHSNIDTNAAFVI